MHLFDSLQKKFDEQVPPIADTRELCYNTFKWRKVGAFFHVAFFRRDDR